jgi:hypothetical protein
VARHLASRFARQTFRALGSVTTLASQLFQFLSTLVSAALFRLPEEAHVGLALRWLLNNAGAGEGALRKRVHYLVAATTSLFQTVLQSVKGP